MKKIPIAGTLFAAFIASFCCLGPALLAAVGFGGTGLAAYLARFHWPFYILGLGILGLTFFLLIKQNLREACCLTKPALTRSILKALSLMVALGVLFFGFQYGLTHPVASWLYKQPAIPPASSSAESHTVLVSISGMTCISCARGIEAHLKQIPGIFDAEVSFKKKKALVCYNPRQLSKNDIEKHIDETGYGGKTISETICAKPGLSGNSL